MSRMINLAAWAQLEFGDNAPSQQVLIKYAKANMMVPPALKVGKRWMIDRDSRYVGVISTPQLPNHSNEKIAKDLIRWQQDLVLIISLFQIYIAS